MPLTRRAVLRMGAICVIARPTHAAGAVAVVTAATADSTMILPDGSSQPLAEGQSLPAGAGVATLGSGRIGLRLNDGTRVNAGENTLILLVGNPTEPDRLFSLNVSGAAVVDRRSVSSRDEELNVTTVYFALALDTARVYLASLDVGKVLVSEGEAHLTLPEEKITLTAGEGVTLAPPPARSRALDEVVTGDSASIGDGGAVEGIISGLIPGIRGKPGPEVYTFSEDEMDAAFDSVGLEI